jgi:uncharacterized protein YqeY
VRPAAAGDACGKEAIAVLRDQINDAVNDAVKAGNARRASYLAAILWEIRERERKAPERGMLTDAEIVDALGAMIKEIEGPLEIFETAGASEETLEQYREQIAVISEYLP